MTIRKAEKTDAAVLAELLRQLGYPTTVAECEKRITLHQQDFYDLWMGEDENTTVAFIALHWYHALHHTKPIGRVVAFCVDEKFRGKGLGTEMLRQAEDFFKTKGCFKIELTSNLKRKESHAYYIRQGYQQTSMHLVKFLGEASKGI